MDPATLASLMNAGGSLLGGLGAASGGPDVIQPYAGSGGISIGGNNAPAGPIPPVPASPFAYTLPVSGGSPTLQAGMAGDLTTGLIVFVVGSLLLSWIAKATG